MSDSLQVESECRFARTDELTIALAARIWDLMEEAIERLGLARIVLSGGSTPVQLYNVLRELPLDWSSLRFCLSDERWVDTGHEASNEAMLRRELFGAREVSLISMARTADTPEKDAQRVEQDLTAVDGPWDLVLLGMGTDGHTASLFPEAKGLAQALDGERRCVAVEPADAAQRRLTLTRREILNSRRIVLLLSGDAKWRVYREALKGSDVSAMPVRAILQQKQVPVDVYWSAN
ncbi:MAG: 6-phosphogluconolactonase [Gammaproteobacteria bacterium]|nr:6-phosphogluconolactonase [Gammaproteobacteria bacterium]